MEGLMVVVTEEVGRVLPASPRMPHNEAGQKLHGVILTSGSSSDRFTSNHLLHMYSRLDGGIALFSTSMPNKNLMSNNILLTCLLRRHGEDNPCASAAVALKFFDEMPERDDP